MKTREEDTIGAIATPIGEGAIAVIRVSGPDTLGISDIVFRGHIKLAEAKGYTAHYGRIVDKHGDPVDEVVVTVFKRPHSYTGEDSVEISCHGGVHVANEILETILAAGVRLADPGEFTKRAFLNGRIDLSQAEAIADLIAAKSERARRASINQLDGHLKQVLGESKSGLLNICSLLELELDFLEDGIPLVSAEVINDKIMHVLRLIENLVGSYEVGKLYREGISVVLVGKPNVGKSSIFNALLRSNRAIVSSTPGTTRDYLEESITFRGLQFRLVDTAGLRTSIDAVELEGVRRTQSAMDTSDVVLLIDDVSNPIIDAKEVLGPDTEWLNGRKVLRVRNKIDLLEDSSGTAELLQHHIHPVSAKTGDGIDTLTIAMFEICMSGERDEGSSVCITNRRHREALIRARESLRRARGLLAGTTPNEILAIDVREAIDAIGEITGEVTTDEILDEIFSRFCIGK